MIVSLQRTVHCTSLFWSNIAHLENMGPAVLNNHLLANGDTVLNLPCTSLFSGDLPDPWCGADGVLTVTLLYFVLLVILRRLRSNCVHPEEISPASGYWVPLPGNYGPRYVRVHVLIVHVVVTSGFSCLSGREISACPHDPCTYAVYQGSGNECGICAQRSR
jgi:hypothetical protein